MDRVIYIKPNFSSNAFAGTAGYYLQYRFPYPETMLKALIGRSRATGEGRLLDLACGPGRVALALASSFQEIWAIDLEPEMVEVGQKEAARRELGNIQWRVGRAETLVAPNSAFELITIGEAFHRLDQQVVATRALQWLKPGGYLALLGCHTFIGGTQPWQKITVETVHRWTGRISHLHKEPEPPLPGSGPDHYEHVLLEEGFEDVASHPFEEPHDWTIESILGYLYSTSVCSKRVLGDKVGGFEADLRAALIPYGSEGVFRETLRWGFTLGRKPN